MTNSLNTPIEAIESALPIVVEATTLRRGSGGLGRHRGGDGTRRELRVLVPVSASLLTERRNSRPWGLEGGRPGAAGRNTLRRAGGALEPLPDKGNFVLQAGDRLVIETPGGGGWGGAERVRAARRRGRTGMPSWPAGSRTPGRDPR
jgi:N-methylhydantoinase B